MVVVVAPYSKRIWTSLGANVFLPLRKQLQAAASTSAERQRERERKREKEIAREYRVHQSAFFDSVVFR